MGVYIKRSKIPFRGVMGNFLRYRMLVKWNCDISYSSKIGRNLHLPHPIGIVIGEGAVIHDDVTIFQNVTLGSHGKSGEKLTYPTIERGATIYAGAIIIGGVSIGEGAVIGANSVVNIDVPPFSVAVGIPGRIVSPK
ncbi:serine O-acetyltransferase [Cyclobacterium xiamenense]|uniref:serine O-acetyltransferase n=1 Tax=Cyclobacterium xiamenense TaxID=1297121 RepID=UPI0035CEA244